MRMGPNYQQGLSPPLPRVVASGTRLLLAMVRPHGHRLHSIILRQVTPSSTKHGRRRAPRASIRAIAALGHWFRCCSQTGPCKRREHRSIYDGRFSKKLYRLLAEDCTHKEVAANTSCRFAAVALDKRNVNNPVLTNTVLCTYLPAFGTKLSTQIGPTISMTVKTANTYSTSRLKGALRK